MIESIPDAINFIFILMMFSVILYSTLLNHNNSGFKRIYYFVSSVLGIYGLCVFGILVVNVYQIVFETVQGKSVEDFIIPIIYLRIMIFFIIGGHAIPILWTFSIRKYIEMIVSLLSYLFYAPTYLNILLTFAFCRIDDLSWGTKGLDSDGSAVSRDW
jgi:chitin synthase